MISPEALDACLERVDALVDTISDCELFLDEIFQMPPEEPTPPVVPTVPAMPARSEPEIARAVAARIKQERANRGWRQQDLSAQTGIARPNIARLESGKRMPKLSTLQKIAEAMGLRMEDLME